MGTAGGEELLNWDKRQGIVNGKEEKILVLVRLRPLSEKEIARNEASDWECINTTTILYRNSLQERSGLPSAYTFDQVFRGHCSTREVYLEGTKDAALSVVDGINSTIFAYGQTSSGKTYTMNGITQYTVADIYSYIQKASKFYIFLSILGHGYQFKIFVFAFGFFRLNSFPVYSPSFVSSSLFSYLA